MEISAGKLWAMRRLADADGRFRMLAVDQRTPLLNTMERLGGRRPTDGDLADLKRRLTRALAPEASATLVDATWGYTAGIMDVPAHGGLLVALEDHAYTEDADGGRRAAEMEGWSAATIKRLGADGVKLLIYHRPDASAAVRAHQEAFVERVGRDCVTHDLCFLLELVQYPLKSERDGGVYAEHKGKRPDLVVESLKTFTDPRFHVDIFKLESPLPAAAVPDPDSAESAECQRWFDALGEATTRPWVLLSAGAGADAFGRILAHAYRAGASGFLAGRAIWGRAVENYPDLDAVDRALAGEATEAMRGLGRLTSAAAQPWMKHPAFADGVRIAGADGDFARLYAATA